MDEAPGLLHRYSLVERIEQTLTLHRLVQEVIQDVLAEEERQKWMERAVLVVNAVFPSGAHGTWELCEFLLPHALICAQWISVLRQRKLEGGRLLSGTGRYLYERAQYTEAELILQRALSIAQEQLDTSHPQTAGSLNNLAELYKKQGRYTEAEPLFQRAAMLSQASLGMEHPQTQQIVMNYLTLLSNLYTNGDMDALLQLLAQKEQEDNGGNEGSSE
jgi:tetratricopeptide (TPR) repeat protein